ncbi:Enoyl-CoA hydratase/carnithine racemase [Enhydrobacter aerosaccus]|uniref:Enoyl-CoA hydratase/carnithine racemase n=1 Tax=Enhydrobacter aerosaccus TaxID=225324 RepID=A0A1T4JRR2_9HYPH|nr:Enoyl-CoA hydratase/carnithine racemase [Enhydrobacter aerosaccus]
MSQIAAGPLPAVMPDELLYGVDGAIATVTLNAPQRMNTISGPMLKQLTDALVRANEDKAVRVVILTGTGRAFCAGLNLEAQSKGKDNLSVGSGATPTNIDLRNTPPPVLHAMDKPVIAALNGSAAGYGLDLALGADIRIMAQSAKLAASYAKRGVLPESGGTWYLPRLLGWAKAAEIIFTGRTLDAEQSLALGLVNRVVPDADVLGVARELALEIAANAPLAIQAAKRMMRMAWNEPFNEHVHHVFLQLLPLMQTEDMKEGIRAFLEKREPNFTGR